MRVFNLQFLKNKIKSCSSVNLKIPIVGFLMVVIQIYFLWPPEVVYLEKELKAPTGIVKEIKKGSTVFKYDIDLYFTNNSFRSGYVDNYEIFPQGIPKIDFNIISSRLERKKIKWKHSERISFSITIEQNIFNKQGQGSNIMEVEPLIIRFFADDGSNILNEKGDIAYLIFGTKISDKPFE